MFDPQYKAQVRLLLHCLPEIDRHSCFALKGGTAINFFVRDLPRVSVDIDLTYHPLKPRHETLQEIHDTLLSIKDAIERRIPMKRGEPEWDRLGIEHLAQLPAIQWKLINIRKMESLKHKTALNRLIKVLSM